MRPLLPLVAVTIIFLFYFSLAQTDAADVVAMTDLCNSWRNPNFDDWPADCNGTTVCSDSTSNWTGIICRSGRVSSMFVVISLSQTPSLMIHTALSASIHHILPHYPQKSGA